MSDPANRACTVASHEAAKKDLSAWGNMIFIGIQEVCPEYGLELRNCKCGSTLAKKIAY